MRASHGSVRGWLREDAGTLLRSDGTSGFLLVAKSSPGLCTDAGDETRAVSGFFSGRGFDGKGMAKGKGKSRSGKDKCKSKKGENGKEQPDRNDQFQGNCGHCEKWRHKRVDCRKRIAYGKTKGGAAASSVDNDGEVQPVMEIDD